MASPLNGGLRRARGGMLGILSVSGTKVLEPSTYGADAATTTIA